MPYSFLFEDPPMPSDANLVAVNSCNQNFPVVQNFPISAASKPKRFPLNLPSDLGITIDQATGKAIAVMRDKPNPYALQVGSRALDNIIRKIASNLDITLTRYALDDINEHLKSHAEMSDAPVSAWARIAPISGGIEIDLGDENHTRVKIADGVVNLVHRGSESIFCRSVNFRPMFAPSENGNYKLLKNYVNLDWISFKLFVAWLTYTLAHPKVSSSKYVILTVYGGQGTGKSVLSNIIKDLIDPSVVGVEVMPRNDKDLAIAASQSHVLCYDNLRHLSPNMADTLCVAATGGAKTSRKLYTDGDQHVLKLHVALVLNGIHSFIDQPDLAQRCLPLYLQPIAAGSRRSEVEMAENLKIDMPTIQRGLFDLIAKIYPLLSTVKATEPERMIDFSHWLAAMEVAEDEQEGAYQGLYSDALKEGQRNVLVENLLAAAILEFSEALDEEWTGTPTQLLAALNFRAEPSTQRSRDWPENSIALSKRLQSSITALSTQGIRVIFSRGKERMITISKVDEK